MYLKIVLNKEFNYSWSSMLNNLKNDYISLHILSYDWVNYYSFHIAVECDRFFSEIFYDIKCEICTINFPLSFSYCSALKKLTYDGNSWDGIMTACKHQTSRYFGEIISRIEMVALLEKLIWFHVFI